MSETKNILLYLAVDHEGDFSVDRDSASDAAYNLSMPVHVYEISVTVTLPKPVHTLLEIDATGATRHDGGIELGSIKLTLPD